MIEKIRNIILTPFVIILLPLLIRKISIFEIIKIFSYFKTLFRSNPKIANEFIVDLVLLSYGKSFITDRMMDAKLPNIIIKLSNSNIEKAFGKKVSDVSPLELRQYIDLRMKKVKEKRIYELNKRIKDDFSVVIEKSFKSFKQILDKKQITFFVADNTLKNIIYNDNLVDIGQLFANNLLGNITYDSSFIETTQLIVSNSPGDVNIDDKKPIISVGIYAHQTDIEKIKEIFSQYDDFSVIFYSNSDIVFEYQNKVRIQLFIYHIDQKQKVVYHENSIMKFINTPFSLSTINTMDIDILVPTNYDLYLCEYIGNWNDEILFFNPVTYPFNIEYKKNINSLMYFTDELKLAIKHGNRDRFIYSNKVLKENFEMDYMQYYSFPKDGMIIDNKEPRKYLCVFDIKDMVDNYDSIVIKLFKQIQGQNIKVDIALVDDKNTIFDISNLQVFDFVDKIDIYDSCDKIKYNTQVYNMLVFDKNIYKNQFSNYPSIFLK
jgi:hypothetical protein